MNERERVIAICRDLRLPQDQYIINGSGAMIMQGITAEQRGKPMGDLDVFCSTKLWFDLLRRVLPVTTEAVGGHGRKIIWSIYCPDPSNTMERCDPPYLYATMYGLPVHVFYDWRRRPKGNFDVAFYLCNRIYVDGIPCTPLQWVLDWKRETGRAKDVTDIRALEEFLGDKAL